MWTSSSTLIERTGEWEGGREPEERGCKGSSGEVASWIGPLDFGFANLMITDGVLVALGLQCTEAYQAK